MSDASHDPVQRLNEHHADDLLAVVRAFGGHPDASAARAERVDLDGIGLVVETVRGPVSARVAFPEPVEDPDRLRVALVRLARRARAALAPARE